MIQSIMVEDEIAFERRSIPDRRSVERGTPDRRKPGRPRKENRERYQIRSIRLTLAEDAEIERIAAARGMTRHGVLLQAVRRLVDVAARLGVSCRSETDGSPNLP